MRNLTMKKYIDLLFGDAPADAGTDSGADNATGGSGGKDDSSQNKTDKDDRNTPKYSENDLDRLMAEKDSKFKKKYESKLAEQVAEEVKKFQNMSDLEIEKAKNAELQKKYDEIAHKMAMSDMKKVATDLLAKEGVLISEDLLDYFVSEDADQTQAAVKAIAAMYKRDLQNAVNEAIGQPEPMAGGGTPKPKNNMTREDLSKIKDSKKYREAILSNPELFPKFSKAHPELFKK